MKYLPSVTEVISPWVDFSKISPDILQAAADRGTDTHDACSRIAKGEWVIPSPEITPYVDSFRLWFATMVAKVILTEERFISESWGFSGQIDLFVELKDKHIALIDEKTSVALKKAWRVQMAAYRFLCEENGHKIDCVGSLRLSPKGKIGKVDWYENSVQDFNIFIQCLQVYRFFNS